MILLVIREIGVLRHGNPWRREPMSMHPSPIEPVPDETARVARAAFRKGNLLMRIRDEIGILYDDQMFASLYDARGQLAISPWRLALVTVFQFLETLGRQPRRCAAGST